MFTALHDSSWFVLFVKKGCLVASFQTALPQVEVPRAVHAELRGGELPFGGKHTCHATCHVLVSHREHHWTFAKGFARRTSWPSICLMWNGCQLPAAVLDWRRKANLIPTLKCWIFCLDMIEIVWSMFKFGSYARHTRILSTLQRIKGSSTINKPRFCWNFVSLSCLCEASIEASMARAAPCRQDRGMVVCSDSQLSPHDWNLSSLFKNIKGVLVFQFPSCQTNERFLLHGRLAG